MPKFGPGNHCSSHMLCNRCNRAVSPRTSVPTRLDLDLCIPCAQKMNFCEICGSTGDDPDTQLHYDEDCFK